MGGARRNRDISGYQRGIIKGVVAGACTFQTHLEGAGLADSALCPFCDLQEVEDAAHAYWRCPAWKAERKQRLGVEAVDVSGLPPSPSIARYSQSQPQHWLQRPLFPHQFLVNSHHPGRNTNMTTPFHMAEGCRPRTVAAWEQPLPAFFAERATG